MNKQNNDKQTFKSVMNQLSHRERIIMLAQTILSVLILIIAILGLCNIGPAVIMNIIALILLALLLVVNAFRLYPTRKLSAVIYIFIAVIIIIFLATSQF